MTGPALWVLPSIDRNYGDACLATLRAPHVLRIDNAPPNHNRGVNASWNAGIRAARGMGAEWVVLLSESVRFGPAGGLDFEARFDGPYCNGLLGWHLIALRMDTVDKVGLFDENLISYLGDTDYLVRLHLAGLPSPRENDLPGVVVFTDLDVTHLGTEHSIKAGFVHPDFNACHGYFAQKWGSPEPHARWAHPFNDQSKDWTWWPTPPDPRSIL